MVESSNSGNSGLVVLGVGLLLGGFLVYVILKSKEQQPAAMAYPQSPQPPVLQPIIIYQPPVPQNIPQPPPVPAGFTPAPEKALPPPMQAPVIFAPSPEEAPSHKVQAFQNEEEWVVKKDKRGRLEGITVHRKVTPVD